MQPMPGAIEAFHELSGLFDTYILSTAPWHNPSAWQHKVEWVHLHFGEDEYVDGKENPAYKRLILSHHKNLNRGHFLVDDLPQVGQQARVLAEQLQGADRQRQVVVEDVRQLASGQWTR